MVETSASFVLLCVPAQYIIINTITLTWSSVRDISYVTAADNNATNS